MCRRSRSFCRAWCSATRDSWDRAGPVGLAQSRRLCLVLNGANSTRISAMTKVALSGASGNMGKILRAELTWTCDRSDRVASRSRRTCRCRHWSERGAGLGQDGIIAWRLRETVESGRGLTLSHCRQPRRLPVARGRPGSSAPAVSHGVSPRMCASISADVVRVAPDNTAFVNSDVPRMPNR